MVVIYKFSHLSYNFGNMNNYKTLSADPDQISGGVRYRIGDLASLVDAWGLVPWERGLLKEIIDHAI